MKLAVLMAAVLATWVVAVPVAVVVDGPGHWLAGTVAALLCLLPAIGTLVMLTATERQSTAMSLGAVLIAPLLRIVVVVLAGFALGYSIPEFRAAPLRFLGWLLTFYLLTLVVETALVLPRAMKPPVTERTNGL